MAHTWEFKETYRNGSYIWQWRQVDGKQNSPKRNIRSFPSYGAAIQSAIEHGFYPREDHWTVESTTGVTSFDGSTTTSPNEFPGRFKR